MCDRLALYLKKTSDDTERKDAFSFRSFPVHSVDVDEALHNKNELSSKKWSNNTAADKRHSCILPLKSMRTIMRTPESKRQTIIWKILDSEYVVSNPTLLASLVPNKSEREALIASRTTDVLLRKMSTQEQKIFQGFGFIRFPPELTDCEVHALLGNSVPPRVASCIFHAMRNVQILRYKHHPEGWRFPSGWENPTMIELFAGIGGFSMGADYADSWCDSTGVILSGPGSAGRSGYVLINGEEKKLYQTSNSDGSRSSENWKNLDRALGFRHLLLVDFSEICGKVLKSQLSNGKMMRWKKTDILLQDAGTVDLRQYRDKLGVLCGGPPCQSFSLAGQRKCMKDNRAGWAICASGLLQTNAETFVFENVKAACQGKMGTQFHKIKNMLIDPHSYFRRKIPIIFDTERRDRKLSNISSAKKREAFLIWDAKRREEFSKILSFVSNYLKQDYYPHTWSVSWTVLDCSDYGVPQKRERLFVIGYRIKRGEVISPGLPLTRTQEFLEKYKRPDKRTVWEVIKTHAKKNDDDWAELEDARARIEKKENLLLSRKQQKANKYMLWSKIDDDQIGTVQ